MKSLSIVLAVLTMALTPPAEAGVKNVVLVHGAFADGSGWRPVATILEHDGYSVYVVQEPLTSWDADLAATRSVLDRAGPCVLVAHSWGGMIITEVGDRPSVRSLCHRLRRRCAEGHGSLYGDVTGTDRRRLLRRQDNGRGLVEKAEFRSDSAAGSADQSRA
jgi:pimeloyl-ACP methyl ester carboxylesterase